MSTNKRTAVDDLFDSLPQEEDPDKLFDSLPAEAPAKPAMPPDNEIDAMFKPKSRRTTVGEAALGNFAEGSQFDWAEELAAKVDNARTAARGLYQNARVGLGIDDKEPIKFDDKFRQQRSDDELAFKQRLRDHVASTRRDHPGVSALSHLGGNLASSIALNGLTGGASSTAAGNAILGGVQGAGSSDAPLFSKETALSAGIGAALGGAFGKAGQGAPVKTGIAGAALGGAGALFGDKIGMSEADRVESGLGGALGLAGAGAAALSRGRNAMADEFSEGASRALSAAQEERRPAVASAQDSVSTMQSRLQASEAAPNRIRSEQNVASRARMERFEKIFADARAKLADVENLPEQSQAAARVKAEKQLAKAEQLFTSSQEKLQTAKVAKIHSFADSMMKAQEDDLLARNKAFREGLAAEDKTLSGAQKAATAEAAELGGRRQDAQQNANKGFVEAFMLDEARRSAGELAAAPEGSDAWLKARSALGHYVSELYARNRTMLDNEQEISPTFKRAIEMTLPDYVADSEAHASKIVAAGGKRGLMEEFLGGGGGGRRPAGPLGETPPPATEVAYMSNVVDDGVAPKADPLSFVSPDTMVGINAKHGVTPDVASKHSRSIRAQRLAEKLGLDPELRYVPADPTEPELVPLSKFDPDSKEPLDWRLSYKEPIDSAPGAGRPASAISSTTDRPDPTVAIRPPTGPKLFSVDDPVEVPPKTWQGVKPAEDLSIKLNKAESRAAKAQSLLGEAKKRVANPEVRPEVAARNERVRSKAAEGLAEAEEGFNAAKTSAEDPEYLDPKRRAALEKALAKISGDKDVLAGEETKLGEARKRLDPGVIRGEGSFRQAQAREEYAPTGPVDYLKTKVRDAVGLPAPRLFKDPAVRTEVLTRVANRLRTDKSLVQYVPVIEAMLGREGATMIDDELMKLITASPEVGQAIVEETKRARR